MSNINSTVLSVSDYSTGFPEVNNNEIIEREHYLFQLESLFQDFKTVFLEGEEESGKTTICAQYCKYQNCISVFFNPLNTNDYNLEFYYSNVIEQIKFIVGDRSDAIHLPTIENYRNQLIDLKRYYKRKKKSVYIVIDGLENKCAEQKDFLLNLVDILPIGDEYIRLLITGSEKSFVEINSNFNKTQVKSFTLLGFSNLEISKFLNLDEKTITQTELYRITKGYPGRLKTLKRLIEKQGYDIESITNDTSYKNWVELNCEKIDIANSTNKTILAILSLKDQAFYLNDFSKICDLTNDVLKDIILNLFVLEINSDDSVYFSSNTYKKYYSNIFRTDIKSIDKLLINYYASTNNLNSQFELSKIYASKNNWDKVSGIINQDYLINILKNSGSLKIVNDSLDLGFKASTELKKYPEICKYSVQGSILNELDNFLFWESEILARIALKDYRGAISLAEGAVLKVDRLRLLALIAKKQKQTENKVFEDLIDTILQIYNEIDLGTIGNVIYDIVSDLIYALPNLAIEMIEKSSGNSNEKDINDWVIAKLSFAAINSTSNEDEKKKNLTALNNLNNPDITKINRAITFLVSNYTSKKVLEEVSKIKDSKEKLKLLRLWLKNNTKYNSNVDLVINKSIDLLIDLSSKDLITIDILKDLTQQLPYIKDNEIKHKIYSRFKRIESEVSDLGISKYKYLYDLNIFHTEFTIDGKKSLKTLASIILEIDGIEDVLIKIEAFAEVYAKLKKLPKVAIYKEYNYIYVTIKKLVHILENSSADHFKIFKGISKTIAKINLSFALEICNDLNTSYNRDRIKLVIIDSYLENSIRYISINELINIYGSFEDKFYESAFHKSVLDRFTEAKSLPFDVITKLMFFYNEIKNVSIISNRVYFYLLFYKIIAKNSNWKEKLNKTVKSKIINNLELIDSEWEKIDICFIICSEIVDVDIDFANQVFKLSGDLKKDNWLDSKAIADIYISSVKLVIKAFRGLLNSDSNSPRDIETLENLISVIPSKIEKLNLWTEIAILSLNENKSDVAKTIYDKHTLPIVQELIHKKIDIEKISNAIILVHNYNPEIAIEYVEKLNYYKEECYLKILEYHIKKTSPFDVYDNDVIKYQSNNNDILKAISLLNHLSNDNAIYINISEICDSIINNKNKFSQIQLNEIISKLEIIVDNKLPQIKNIKHEGYKILSQIHIDTLRKNKKNWKNYIEKTNQIPNLSDKLFVKSFLIEHLPFSKFDDGKILKNNLFNEIIEHLKTLKSHYEFVDRVTQISENMYKTNRTVWKNVINEAFSFADNFNSKSDSFKFKRKIIDTFHRIDSEYTKKLIALNENENEVNNLLKEHYKTLEISQEIKNNKSITDKELDNHRNIVSAIYKAEKALNSGKISAKSPKDVSKYLSIGNKLPLTEVFPIYSFYFLNCAKTVVSRKDKSIFSKLHKENFNKMVEATNLVQFLTQKRRMERINNKSYFIDEKFESNKSIKPGSREEALNFINQWILDEVEEFVIITDPYFNVEDISILKIFKSMESKSINIDILSSGKVEYSIKDELQDYWKRISDETIPFVNFTYCWIPEDNNNHPIHDRWIISKNGGLRLGTSINSLGIKKESEISVMDSNQALKIQEETLKLYLSRRKRELNNQKISYISFNL